MGTTHVRVPDPLYQAAVDVKERHEYPSIGEALRHMAQEAGYDV